MRGRGGEQLSMTKGQGHSSTECYGSNVEWSRPVNLADRV